VRGSILTVVLKIVVLREMPLYHLIVTEVSEELAVSTFSLNSPKILNLNLVARKHPWETLFAA
jgi:hypothetical protein